MSYVPPEMEPKDWEALSDAWKRFVSENPQLGFSHSEAAAGRFARKHYDELSMQGALTKGILGRYLAHREKFPNAAFTVIVEHAA